MATKSANPKRIKVIAFLLLALAGLLLAISGILPMIVNLALTPWQWFFRAFLLKGKGDALANIPFLSWLSITYRYSYLALFWFVQTVQCSPGLLALIGVSLSPERTETLNKLRNIGYGIELVVNVLYGWYNPWGTDDTFIVYRIIVTLISVVAQTFSFEWTLQVIFMAIGVFTGGLVDNVKRPKTVNANATVA